LLVEATLASREILPNAYIMYLVHSIDILSQLYRVITNLFITNTIVLSQIQAFMSSITTPYNILALTRITLAMLR
jgi:hypothetical protein